MGTQGIAVFDVCGVVTRTNNTSDFIGFVLKRDSAFRYGLFLLLRVLCLAGRFPGIRRIIRDDLLRRRQISLLKGCSMVRLRELAGQYVEMLASQGLLNRRIVDTMGKERERGNVVLFVSAAIDPPIAALAERFGIGEFFSSELETANCVCTGRLKSDLLGRKQVVLEQLAVGEDGRDSSAYSDNPEDAAFMEPFARRYIVLNTTVARRMWRVEEDRFCFLVNYEVPDAGEDIDSVNERTVRWTYLPTLYYAVSRLHRRGLCSVFLREIVPAVVAGWLFTSLGPSSLFLMPLSFVAFFCVYEIGGLVNDLYAEREPADVRARRIAPDMRIHTGLFVAIRIVAVGLLLACLPLTMFARWVYAGLLCLCLAVYLVHTALPHHRRVGTAILLKLCRSCMPLAILLSFASLATVAWLCAIFFLLDGLWRIYVYAHRRGLILGRVPVSRVRCSLVTLLWGLGVGIYLVAGSSCLLIMGSYYLLLECGQIRRHSCVRTGTQTRETIDPPAGGRRGVS